MKKMLLPLLIISLFFSCTSKKEQAQELVRSGKSKLYSSQLQEALEDLNKAVELYPDFDQALFYRAKVKQNLRDDEGAMADYNACIAVNPSFPDAWEGRGTLSFQNGDRDNACKDWHKAKELGKSNIEERLMNCP